MTNRTIILILLLIISNSIFPQVSRDDRELVKVGIKSISEGEFKQRLEFIPHYGRTASDPDSVFKYELLYTLIAEKLLSLKAEELSLDTTTFVSTPVRYIEKMLVRDALYKVEVINNSRIDTAYYKKGIERFFTTLNTRYFLFSSKEEADSVYTLLGSHPSIDSLLNYHPGLKKSLNNFAIKFGDFNSEMEDLLFLLKENEYSIPVKLNNHWYLFWIDKIVFNYPFSQQALTKAERKVTSVVKQRNSESAYNHFYKNFFKDKKIRANSVLNNSFVKKIKSHIENSGYSDSIIYFTNRDALKMEESFGPDSLNSVFIESEDYQVTLKEFIREFTFEGFNYSRKDSLSVEHKLSARLKEYMQQHLLVFEGYKRGFQYLPDVINDLRMWRDYYLSLAMKENIFNSVQIPDSSQLINSLNQIEERASLNNLRSAFRETTRYQKLLKETQYLADRYKIYVDKEIFKSIQSSYINLFVFRYFGFGGHLPVVPMNSPFTEWFKLWNSKNKISF